MKSFVLGILFAVIPVITAFFVFNEKAIAAAWTQPFGRTQVVKTYSFYSTETQSANETSRFLKLEFNPLVEVGATNNLTIGISPNIQQVTTVGSFSGVEANAGLTSFDAFFRYKIWQDDFTVASIQPLVKVPAFYDESISPSLGQKQVDYELRGLVGRSFQHNNEWHFVNLETAYRKRFEEPSDEFRADFTLGYRFYRDLMFMPQIFSTFALDNSTNTSVNSVVNSNDFDLVKLQFSFVKEVDKKNSVQLGVYSHYISNNTGGGGGIILSYWTKF